MLKKDSPTCGLERVKVYGTGGMPVKSGRGLFADALVTRFPRLPVEEEGRLNDPRLRENFIERVFAYRRLAHLFAVALVDGRRRAGSIRFTSSRSWPTGRSPISVSAAWWHRASRWTGTNFRIAIRPSSWRRSVSIATPRRQANVLQHMLGYFKQTLDRESRAELLGLIEDHAIGRVPLVVPLTLFGHHIRRCGVPYLADQVYLRPHPVELMLRNHV